MSKATNRDRLVAELSKRGDKPLIIRRIPRSGFWLFQEPAKKGNCWKVSIGKPEGKYQRVLSECVTDETIAKLWIDINLTELGENLNATADKLQKFIETIKEKKKKQKLILQAAQLEATK